MVLQGIVAESIIRVCAMINKRMQWNDLMKLRQLSLSTHTRECALTHSLTHALARDVTNTRVLYFFFIK